MVFSWSRIKKSASTALPFISKYLPVLVILQLINFFFTQTLSYIQELRMSSHTDDMVPWMIAIAVIGFLAQSMTKVVWVLLACHHATQSDPDAFDFVKKNLEQSLIESLSAFFRAIIYAFLFIIPGLIKMIRYQFVIFVVALEKEYDQGTLSALQFSEKLTKKHFFSLLALALLFTLILLPGGNNPFILQAPVRVIGLEVFSFLIVTFETLYILYLYQDLRKLVSEGQK